MRQPKNFVLISPHFPDNFATFAVRLYEKGFHTLGIADTPYEQLSDTIKNSLTEYYRVNDMEDYDQVYRAVAFFAHKYGRIDRIESHNEYWLELDAKLRTDFNVAGYKETDLDPIKKKSSMKERFLALGLPAAKGRVFESEEDAFALANELHYPVIVKPDTGVGAGDTYKIHSDEELAAMLAEIDPEVSFIMEEFIAGDMVTFDGLCDREGNIVFYSSMAYNMAVLETVENDSDMYYYFPRQIPEDLIEMGTKMVAGFNVRERFFHFEFFRTDPEGKLVPLEVNMRPPGGPSIDMYNYVNEFDIFAEYANVVKENRFKSPVRRLYNCAYVSRKDNQSFSYRHDNEEIRHYLGAGLVGIQSIPDVFSTIMGTQGYIVRSPDLDELFSAISYISEKN